MSNPEPTPRPDLAALRIHREEEQNYSGSSLGRIVVWLIVLAILAGAGYATYTKVIVPRRAPVVEIVTVKPTVDVANPALLTATGYLVANKQSKITPKISGKVLKLN